MPSENEIECKGCIFNGAMDTYAIAACMGCEDGDSYTKAVGDDDDA